MLSSSSDKARVTVSLPRWRCSSPRPRLGRARLGTAWDGSVGQRGGGSRALPAVRDAGAAASAGASAAATRFFLGGDARLLGGGFLGLAVFFGAALLVLALRDLGPLFALARFLRQAQALFLGFALHALEVRAALRDLLGFGQAARRRRRPEQRASAPAWALRRRARASGASTGGASPGRPRMRRFLTSTTTVFERPWLKLCLTLPVSTVRLRPSGGRVPSFGLSVWSAILFLRQIFVSRAGPQGGFAAFQTSIGASESPPTPERVARHAQRQRDRSGRHVPHFRGQVPWTR